MININKRFPLPTPHSPILFNVKILLFFLFSLFSFNLISCDLINAVNDPDYFELIDEEIAWANTEKLTVTVAIPQSWGTSPQMGTNRCFDEVRTKETARKGYSFEVEFTPEAAFSLLGWRAYATSTLESLKIDWLVDPDILSREKVPTLKGVIIPELPARGGKGSFTLNTTEPVTLVPWCKAEPYVIRTDPQNDPSFERYYHPPSPVVIYFNGALNADMVWKLEEGIINIKGRAIGSNNEYKVINDYFNVPVYESRSGSYTVTVKPKGTMPDMEIMMTIGPNIYSTDFEGMSKAEILYYKVVDAVKLDARIATWNASYTGGKINISWTLTGTDSSKAKVEVYFQENRGAMIKLDGTGNTCNITNTGTPDYNEVRQGNGVSLNSIREYTIYLEFYVGGYYSGVTPIKIWNIPGMSVSNTSPLIEVTSATGDSDDSDGTISLANLKLNNANVKYVLVNDITLTSWKPIGDDTNSFQGKFYGNGHKVTISSFAAPVNYMGLFGYASNALICDLTVEYSGFTITGGSTVTSVGGIAGNAVGSTEIRNCAVRGVSSANILKITGTSLVNVGGITGYIGANVIINNCLSALNIEPTHSGTGSFFFGGVLGDTATSGTAGRTALDGVTVTGNLTLSKGSGDTYIGGIAGRTRATVKVNDLECSGTITAEKTSTGNNYIGGVMGNIQNLSMTNCYYEEGSIIVNGSSNNSVGGFVGKLDSNNKLENCYSRAKTVKVTTNGDINAGGFVGYIDGSNISRCYSLSYVYAENSNNYLYVGGLAGLLGVGCEIFECYASGDVKGINTGSGGATAFSVGGLLGYSNSSESTTKIYNCYALGAVTFEKPGGDGYVNVGGITGVLQNYSNQIDHCFFGGTVTAIRHTGGGANPNIRVGGIVGFGAGLPNCAVIGSSITALGGVNRYVGRIYGAGSGSPSNYALTTMLIEVDPSDTTYTPATRSASPSASGIDGANASASTFRNQNFWTNTLGFSSEIWEFDRISRGYPTLKGLGGQ